MKRYFIITTVIIFTLLSLVQAQSGSDSFDSYITNTTDNVFTEIAGGGPLNKPNDLDFNPAESNGENELWIICEGTESSGGWTVTLLNAGESNQSVNFKKDGNSWHFMSLPTAIAFGDEGYFANSPGVFDANHNGGAPFTGPALWESDFSVYAITPPGGNGSHLDMLHQSPYSMGIAHEKDNVYWVNDGYNSTIVMYDFSTDHGPGNTYHDDGRVHFYYDITTKRDVSGIPGHLVVDKANDWLYISDTGNDRILRMKIGSGSKKKDLPFAYETLAERWEMENVTWEVVADSGLSNPCGIEVFRDRLVVTNNASNEIIIYDISSSPALEVGRIAVPHSNANIRGVEVDNKGRIWFVDYNLGKVFMLENQNVIGVKAQDKIAIDISIYPNPVNDKINLQLSQNIDISRTEILNTSGQTVFSSQISSAEINVSDLKSGLYFLRMIDQNGNSFTERFVKN